MPFQVHQNVGFLLHRVTRVTYAMIYMSVYQKSLSRNSAKAAIHSDAGAKTTTSAWQTASSRYVEEQRQPMQTRRFSSIPQQSRTPPPE
eukprot:CAMPEP_0116101214 /NCGR_PEP_ID=MMETSP0327-20121206/12693_1 /TAXON_ID=44447 /ORGANISM="Pseudo-nitzschia delicatissima, Strain B596" /LENGTH=88 /DNA_ID=CAMNT_0003593165 /DNA_START=265 /DNA_END=531 /DNA_ORIENTATION=+